MVALRMPARSYALGGPVMAQRQLASAGTRLPVRAVAEAGAFALAGPRELGEFRQKLGIGG